MTDDGNIGKLPRAERTAITLAMAKVADMTLPVTMTPLTIAGLTGRQ